MDLPLNRADAMAYMEREAGKYGYTAKDVIGRGQAKNLMRVRKLIGSGLVEMGWSLWEVGEMLNREHTTILYYRTGK